MSNSVRQPGAEDKFTNNGGRETVSTAQFELCHSNRPNEESDH